MTDPQLIAAYNYDEFIEAKILPWMKFGQSPALGQPAPDFPLWELTDQDAAGRETSLAAIWSRHLYTIVEFGSFT